MSTTKAVPDILNGRSRLRPYAYVMAVMALGGWALAAPPSAAQQPAPAAPVAQESAQDFAQEPFVIEQFHTRIAYDAEGRARREQEVRVRVQSDAGVQILGQLVFGYNSANEVLTFDYIRVRKADGSVVEATSDNVQDLTLPVAREAPIYTDYRQKHVTVPGLRPGETLEYRSIIQLHTPLAPGHFWLQHNFSDQAILLDERLEVRVPRLKAVQMKNRPGFDPDISEEGETRVYRWKHANLERPPGDEDDAPRRKPQDPSVEITTFQSWEEVGQWYAGLERGRILPNDEIRAKVAELVRDLPDGLEKIAAIYDFVAQNYRYVSLSLGLARYQPHPAAEVFANHYGDCKDKHTLLAAMLDAADLRAYPALIHSTRKLNPELPSPTQFDHVISAIPVGDDFIWVDTTTEIAPFRMLTASLRNKQALVIPHDGAARLVETPADPPFPSVQHVEVEGEVSEVGTLTARVRYTLRGDTELLLRAAFRRTPRAQWKQIAQLLAFSDGLRGEVTEVTTSELAATHQPLRVDYQVSQANYLNWSVKRTMLSPPLPGIGMPAVDARAAEEDDAEPLELGTPLDVHIQLRLTVPGRYTVRTPVPVRVARDYAEYRSRYAVEGNVITTERQMAFRMRELPAARVRDYQAFVRAVRSDEGQTFALETETAADAGSLPDSVKTADLHAAALKALSDRDYANAVALFRRVVEQEPKHRYAWNNLGRAYMGLEQYPAAVEAIRRQTEVNPFDEFAWNNMGLALWRQQKFVEAEAAFQKQLEVNPLDRYANLNLGKMLVEQKRYADAMPFLERAVTITPDNVSSHAYLGQALQGMGEKDRAQTSFRKATELARNRTPGGNPASPDFLPGGSPGELRSALSSITLRLNNIDLQTAPVSQQDTSLVVQLSGVWSNLGWVRFEQGDLEGAESFLRAAWALTQSSLAGDRLGQLYERRGEKEKAIRAYAQALASFDPPAETRGRLAALAGGEDKVNGFRGKAVQELSAMRTVHLGRYTGARQASAEFVVQLSPGPKVEDVRMVSGDESMREMAVRLREASYDFHFPDGPPVKILRHGILHCSAATKQCMFVFTPVRHILLTN